MTDSREMSNSLRDADPMVERPGKVRSFWFWSGVAALLCLLLLIFRDGLASMAIAWQAEEYSHGYMLPLVAAFFIWQRSSKLAAMPFDSCWLGWVLTLLGLLVYLVGELGALFAVIQYGFLVTLGGVLLAAFGKRAFRLLLPAYVLLVFAVPLPAFLYNNLSSQLQLISSDLGVTVIRWFGIAVFLEGNVIDLGNYKLQVVEACSGLRYLFPLSALGFIAAVLFNGAWWKKVILFLSTLPLTVLMNSFRIGVIGVLVNYRGVPMAEGFLHDFEGWIVFMACAALLTLEMAVLARLGRDAVPFADAFAIEGPEPLPEGAGVSRRQLPRSLAGALALMIPVAILSLSITHREESVPGRTAFVFFPSTLGNWSGKVDQLEAVYEDKLKFTDYILSDYRDQNGNEVNLYVAYYESQRKGASVHSPRSCLPGGGWRITDLSRREIPSVMVNSQELRVNRALIQMGDERLLVYYWFQQRGRVVTNEYILKGYLAWDAVSRNRTDGALVRLTIPVPAGEDGSKQDTLLSEFAALVEGQLPRFVPN